MAASPSPGRVQKLAANPGTRAALATKFLTPAQQQQRALNARLDTPVVPGSTLTNRALAQERQSAIQSRYGPQESQLGQQYAAQQQVGRDTPSWYDAYLAELDQHQRNTAAQGQAANQALLDLMGSIRGLDQGQADQQGQAQRADAGLRGATPSAQAPQTASDASTVRQALLASFAGQTANQGRAASGYADTLAHVVGPGQKLQAVAQAGRNLGAVGAQQTALKGQEGAYGAQYEAQARLDELKNVLAQQTLGANVAQKQASLAATVRHQKASETLTASGQKLAATSPARQKTQAELDYFHKHGYWPSTGAPKVKAPAKVKPTLGVGSLTPAQEASLVTDANTLAGVIKTAPPTDSKGKPNDIRGNLINGTYPHGKTNDPRLVDLAYDLVHHGGKLSPAGLALAHQLRLHVHGNFELYVAPKKGSALQTITGKTPGVGTV